MQIVGRSSPFGSRTRTRVLLSLELLGDSYPRELGRLLDSPLNGVLRALKTLERDGLVTGRAVGRTRQYRINPSYPAGKELRALLRRLAETDELLTASTATLRRRPRRSGKPL
jgi:DNA-binding transcriptional ArsR family regulator